MREHNWGNIIDKCANEQTEFFFSAIGFVFKDWRSASGGFKSTWKTLQQWRLCRKSGIIYFKV